MIADDGPHPIDELADDFLHNLRRGNRISVDICDRYPELAAEIRELFPTLELLERGKPLDGELPTVLTRGPDEFLRSWVTIDCCVRLAVVGWESSTRRNNFRSASRRAQNLAAQPCRQTLRTYCDFAASAFPAPPLHHTNLVPVFEIGQHEEIHYIAMQFIRGQGLDKVISELVRIRRRHLATPSNLPSTAPPSKRPTEHPTGGHTEQRLGGPIDFRSRQSRSR